MPDQTTIQSGLAGHSAYESNLRDRAARLFRFLAELTSLRIKKTRDVTAYESVFWFKDLPQEREVYSQALGTLNEQEPWLRIDKPKKLVPEKPPEICRGWYDDDDVDDFSSEPQLLSEQKELLEANDAVGAPDHETCRLADAPQVQGAWAAFSHFVPAMYRRWLSPPS